MSYYAMLVVVEADDLDKSFEEVTRPLGRDERIRFVGEPWEIKPISEEYESEIGCVYEAEFGTLEAFDQHPEK